MKQQKVPMEGIREATSRWVLSAGAGQGEQGALEEREGWDPVRDSRSKSVSLAQRGEAYSAEGLGRFCFPRKETLCNSSKKKTEQR